jgi:23S rRNA-/tRNA-specific pseudouridylate synthase
LLGSSDHYHLLEINLITGRHHQIRAQLAAIGCPIKGDVKYGARRGNRDRSIHPCLEAGLPSGEAWNWLHHHLRVIRFGAPLRRFWKNPDSVGSWQKLAVEGLVAPPPAEIILNPVWEAFTACSIYNTIKVKLPTAN